MTHPHWRLCLILLCTMQFVVLLDFSITMIPLPQVQQSMGFTPGGLQWAIHAYGVAIAGAEPGGHDLADGMLTTTQEAGSAVGLAVVVAVSIAVLASGGSAAQCFGYAVLISACMVLVGLACAATVLPGQATRLGVTQ